jgi:hypothetical protein
MKGDFWQVEEITVNGENHGITGRWYIIQDIDIYETVPTALWTTSNGEVTFNWQFRDKAKTFEIVPIDSLCNGTFPELELFSHYISGEYQVGKQSRKEMIFISTSAYGFPGEEVKIRITRQQ